MDTMIDQGLDATVAAFRAPPRPSMAANLDAGTLAALAAGGDEAAWRDVLDGLPLGPEDEDEAARMATRLLPQAAAVLGDDWAEDRLSFVDVSIAAGRLHTALRLLGARAARAASDPAIPILVPAWEQHVLAAAFAADRICRAGRRGVVLAGLTAERAGALPLVRDAEAVLISFAERQAPRRVRDYVSTLRAALPARVTLLLGGPAFASCHIDAYASADRVHATNDPVAALRAAGLDLAPAPAPGRSATGAS